MLFERYSQSEDRHILPKEVDDTLAMCMFLGEIYATLGSLSLCKEKVAEALEYIERYRQQQVMVAKRLIGSSFFNDEDLGNLNKLPEGCLYMVARDVVKALC